MESRLNFHSDRTLKTKVQGGCNEIEIFGAHVMDYTWWPGSGLDTYRRDWTTKVIFHVYQRFWRDIIIKPRPNYADDVAKYLGDHITKYQALIFPMVYIPSIIFFHI